jgi:RNA polymerase-binding transcription factor DksA
MNKEKLEYFKSKLLKEKATLEEELKTVAAINPNNPADWEAKSQVLDTDKAERTEVADRVEGFETNRAILNDLEIRYNEVRDALARIEDGSYGICVVSQDEIEEDRLEANPAATTCKKHL